MPDAGNMQYECHYARYIMDNHMHVDMSEIRNLRDFEEHVLQVQTPPVEAVVECIDTVTTFTHSSAFKAYREFFKNNRKCAEPKIKCVCCANSLINGVRIMPPGPGRIRPEIYVCFNNAKSIKEVVRHEFTHAIQECGGRPPAKGKCRNSLQMEMEAYYCAHQCTSFISCLKRALGSSCAARHCDVEEITDKFIWQSKAWFDRTKASFCKF